jgi:uncharacterized protein (TIGR03437 family)
MRAVFWLLLAAAPAAAQPTLAGCPVFPADHIWNRPVDELPVHPQSGAWVATIGAGRNAHPDFGSGLLDGAPIGIPYIVVPGNQARVPVRFQYADESDPGPYPIPPNPPIEGGPSSAGDRHILIVDRDQCRLYELFAAYPNPDGTWRAGSGAIFDLRSHALRPAGWTSADAAGLPILPGLVRYEEVAAGEIRHALRFTAPQTRREYVWPARHFASSRTGAEYPPMGARFRLQAGYDISGFSPEVQVILRALKRYGMILADNGSAWFLTGAPDDRWNNDRLREIRRLRGSDFEAVDASSLMISPDLGQARVPPGTILAVVNGASYVDRVAAGTIVAIEGPDIGPAVARVLFDGLASPVLYAARGRLGAVIPYPLAGRPSARCEIEFPAARLAPLEVPLRSAAPGIFTLNASGTGPAAVLNQDNTVNSAVNPAERGSVIQIFATGDGGAAHTVAVTIAGRPQEVLYSGPAPGLVAGAWQVNARIHPETKPGTDAGIVLLVGEAASQPGVTVAVR